MDKYTISRTYWFSAAHRLEGHPKCGRLHGHNYKVTVSKSGTPGGDGMVLDYGKMDEVIKPLIDNILDHRYLVSRENVLRDDPYQIIALRLGHASELPITTSTAECLAKWLFDEISKSITVTMVQVDETLRSTATYEYSYEPTHT